MTERFKLLLIVWALLLATIWIGEPFVTKMFLTAEAPRAIEPRGELAEVEEVSTSSENSTADHHGYFLIT
jgi:2-alkenal reductase